MCTPGRRGSPRTARATTPGRTTNRPLVQQPRIVATTGGKTRPQCCRVLCLTAGPPASGSMPCASHSYLPSRVSPLPLSSHSNPLQRLQERMRRLPGLPGFCGTADSTASGSTVAKFCPHGADARAAGSESGGGAECKSDDHACSDAGYHGRITGEVEQRSGEALARREMSMRRRPTRFRILVRNSTRTSRKAAKRM